MIKGLLGRTVFFEADGGTSGGGSGDAGGAAAGAQAGAAGAAGGAEAGTGADELAQLKAQLAEAQGKLTAKEQAEADAQRKAAEEQGNFKSLYEQAQTTLKQLQEAQTAEATKQARLAAARQAGLDESLADRLVGADAAALLADAKALAVRFAPAAPGTGATNNGAQRGNGVGSVEDQVNADWAKRGNKKGGFRFR